MLILLMNLKKIMQIKKACGVSVTASERKILERIVEAEAGGENHKGKVLVGKGALEDYIAVLSQEIYGIHHVKVIVKLEDQCIDVRINASIEPGINIPETSGEIKTNVRETIKKVTGIEVKEIELFFKQIKAKEE